MLEKAILIIVILVFMHGPANAAQEIHTVAGQSENIPCSWSASRPSRITWTKDGSIRIASITECSDSDITSCDISLREGYGGRYAISGSLVSGIQLSIHVITLEDDGVYECKAITSSGIKTDSARLTVTHPPEVREIELYDNKTLLQNQATLYVVINRLYLLNCTVPSPSNPPVTISWFSDDIQLDKQQQTNQNSAIDSPLMTSSRIAELRPSQGDSGKVISCRANHDGLARELQTNVTLEVGDLPESPTNLEVLSSSVTVNSFTVTWQASGGSVQQNFTVKYCLVVSSPECSERTGIRLTRLRIDDLQSFSQYQVWVKSQTVFGASEDNKEVKTYTKPLSPDKLGVTATYDSRRHAIVMSFVETPVDNELDLSQSGLCFQLVYATTTGEVPKEVPGTNCVRPNVNETLLLPAGLSHQDVRVVSYGNNVYSTPMEIANGNGVTTNLGLIVGATAGAVAFLGIVILIIIVKKKNGASTKRTVGTSQRAARGLPSRPQDYRPPVITTADGISRYSATNYQEVSDPPTYEMGQANDLYTMHHSYPAMKEPLPQGGAQGGGSTQYYSRNIKPAVSNADTDKYAYMSPDA